MALEPPNQLNGWDETRETVGGFRNAPQSLYPGRYPTDNSYFPRYEAPAPSSAGEISSSLSGSEAVGLFREAVESARLGIQQSLAGSDKDKVGEAIRAKLTVDLSHRSIEDMPEEIVDIVKRDVEGLSLAHNQIWHIPYRFAECNPIKYLNLRDNLFKEFPKAIYRLPQLEILDLSRNKLGRIPEDIKNMKALRVLSLTYNGIRDLPSCIGSLDGLDILKISENPLNLNLMRVMEGTDGSSSPLSTPHTDNEKERSMTKRIKKYLKTVGATKEYAEESSSDGPLETPRPLKRNLSLRFPVKPSINGLETVIDGKSAGFQRPPIPTRSHFRIASGQGEYLQAAALRRPGAAVQAAGNERIRSNSESILQASQNMTNRSKRMGMVTKKNPDSAAPDEARTNRNSLHYRGQSHGSALRDKNSNGASNGSSFAASQYEQDRQNATFIRRLSSLPEQKNETQSLDNIIEGARGVLYSLHQVHQHISSLIDVLDEGQSERSSLVMVYHNATTQLLLLDGALQDFDKVPLDHEEERDISNRNVRYACSKCIVAYRQIGNLLLRDSSQLIADVDQRYIRTLVLLLYGSLVEARNACLTLGVRFENKKMHAVNQRIPTIHEEVEKRRDRSLTPTREHPNPERRWRNGNAIQQSGNLNVFNPLANAQSSLPPHINGRSRANSRTSTNGSATSSIANTPHSGESFPVSGIPMRSRSNSVMSVPHSSSVRQATADDPEKEYLFEKIFVRLSSSVGQGLFAIPPAQAHFRKCLLEAQNNHQPSKIRNLWGELIWRSGFCLELTEALKNRLSAIKLHEPNNQRHTSDFWRMCVRYINAVVDLLNYVRLAGRDELIHIDLIRTLRPIHLSARDALKDIKASPWMRLIRDNPVEPPRYSSLSNVSNHTYRHHRTAGSSGSGSITSPQSSIPPATPLSAALGVAAQATIPSTPIGLGGGLDRSFQGDVFQRADSLLTLQQTMVYRR